MPGRDQRGEWPDDLDIAALRAGGWRPVPFSQFVIKVHGRCDLDCDYCYVYHAADQSWAAKPASMSPAVANAVCDRIIEHARAHDLPRVAVVLHGGEPLLAPAELFDLFSTRLRHALGSTVDLRIQSNGVSLTEARLDRLVGQGYRFGISLDGGEGAHDRHRTFRDGRGSFARVDRALRLLTSRPGALTGLLCTVDIANDPVTVYEDLCAFAPPVIDFLLPHGNWDTPPPHRTGDESSPYGDWLATIFDHWYAQRHPTTRVRLFAEIMHLWLGGASRVETVGLSPSAVLVVETDGSLEQVDALKSVYHGAAHTGLTVHTHQFDDCLTLPAIVARQVGVAALADRCQQCPVHRVCGGGYYPHRYRTGTGFRNPSVYCADLLRIIGHIGTRVLADVRDLARNS